MQRRGREKLLFQGHGMGRSNRQQWQRRGRRHQTAKIKRNYKNKHKSPYFIADRENGLDASISTRVLISRGGDTPLYGLNGEARAVRPDWVWFSGYSFVSKRGINFTTISRQSQFRDKNGVSLHFKREACALKFVKMY